MPHTLVLMIYLDLRKVLVLSKALNLWLDWIKKRLSANFFFSNGIFYGLIWCHVQVETSTIILKFEHNLGE